MISDVFLYKLPAKHSSCIAVSGLGGHAFGSFKDKYSQHMWLRDSLPDDFPQLRIFIYGYESTLQSSSSVQNLGDIGSSFRDSLRVLTRPQKVRWQPHLSTVLILHQGNDSRRPRPLIFVGHSLGGLVVKEVNPSFSFLGC